MPSIVRYEYAQDKIVEIHPDLKVDSDIELTESDKEEYLNDLYGDTGDTGDTE